MNAQSQIAARQAVSVNPATGEVLGSFACASEAEVRAAVEAARRAQPAWQAAGIKSRLQVLRRFQRLVQERKADIARLVSREEGKPYAEALVTEVLVTLDAARFLEHQAPALLRPQAVPHGNPIMKAKSGRLLRQPWGVVGIISPWNYPFSIPAAEALAALAMGNAVVLKPSELTTMTALELESLLQEAGLPKDLLRVVAGDGATGQALLEAGIDKLVFTGSVATGRRVAQAAAARLLPVVLELGGKDAMLVLEDADVDVASSAAVWGAFVNAGQTCLSVERCYVQRKLYPDFLAACVEKTGRLRVGDGMNPETEVGPLIRERQVRAVEEQVAEAVARGARVLAGGRRLPEMGPNFYAPTVVADVTQDMRIMREETFGPVLPVAAFDGEEEAVRLANDSEFGLAASVWTRDRGRGEALAARLEAGTVMVNDVVSCFAISEAPHGGVKASGWGRTHGQAGLEEMARLKYVDSDLLPGMPKVWWYGYGGRFARQMEGFLDGLFARGIGERLRGGLRSAGALWRKKL